MEFFQKEMKTNEIKNEIGEIKNWEEKIKRKDFKYETKKYIYDFQKYDIVISFVESSRINSWCFHK